MHKPETKAHSCTKLSAKLRVAVCFGPAGMVVDVRHDRETTKLVMRRVEEVHERNRICAAREGDKNGTSDEIGKIPAKQSDEAREQRVMVPASGLEPLTRGL